MLELLALFFIVGRVLASNVPTRCGGSTWLDDSATNVLSTRGPEWVQLKNQGSSFWAGTESYKPLSSANNGFILQFVPQVYEDHAGQVMRIWGQKKKDRGRFFVWRRPYQVYRPAGIDPSELVGIGNANSDCTSNCKSEIIFEMAIPQPIPRNIKTSSQDELLFINATSDAVSGQFFGFDAIEYISLPRNLL